MVVLLVVVVEPKKVVEEVFVLLLLVSPTAFSLFLYHSNSTADAFRPLWLSNPVTIEMHSWLL